MREYLRTNRPELGSEELNTPEGLEESILSGSTVRSDGNIDRRAGIRSRTARKWLNRLGYKWKEVQKGVFFDGHEREDVVEYRETFLNDVPKVLNPVKSSTILGHYKSCLKKMDLCRDKVVLWDRGVEKIDLS